MKWSHGARVTAHTCGPGPRSIPGGPGPRARVMSCPTQPLESRGSVPGRDATGKRLAGRPDPGRPRLRPSPATCDQDLLRRRGPHARRVRGGSLRALAPSRRRPQPSLRAPHLRPGAPCAVHRAGQTAPRRGTTDRAARQRDRQQLFTLRGFFFVSGPAPISVPSAHTGAAPTQPAVQPTAPTPRRRRPLGRARAAVGCRRVVARGRPADGAS